MEKSFTNEGDLRDMTTGEQRYEKAKKAESYVEGLIETFHKDWIIVKSPNRYAKIDCVAYNRREKTIESLIEIKCRNQSMASMTTELGMRTDIDAAKLEALESISDIMKVPSVLYIYLMKDGVVLEVPITDEYGSRMCEVGYKNADAPLSLNGGFTRKKLAEISIEGSRIIKVKGEVTSV